MWDTDAWAPQWALDAGLTAPDPGETMRSYCYRLGVPYDRLTDGLSERTAVNINTRFANVLAENCPAIWRAHVDRWVKAHSKHSVRPTL